MSSVFGWTGDKASEVAQTPICFTAPYILHKCYYYVFSIGWAFHNNATINPKSYHLWDQTKLRMWKLSQKLPDETSEINLALTIISGVLYAASHTRIHRFVNKLHQNIQKAIAFGSPSRTPIWEFIVLYKLTGSSPGCSTTCNDPRQVVRYVTMSPSSIIWYRPKGGQTQWYIHLWAQWPKKGRISTTFPFHLPLPYQAGRECNVWYHDL